MKKQDLIDLINEAHGDEIDIIIWDGNDNWPVDDVSIDTHAQMRYEYTDELVIMVNGLKIDIDRD